MTDHTTTRSIEQAAARFAAKWAGRGYEKGESQVFWTELLAEVFGIANPSEFIRFEEQVHLDHAAFIDGYIDATHVMIEQKSLGKDLQQPILQSDGQKLTPFQQAQRYSAGLPYSKRPRWIVTCNFAEFLVYDMENPNGQPFRILLRDLEREYYRLRFLVSAGNEHLEQEMQVSIEAGQIVGRLYDAILAQYRNPDDPVTLRHLNILCVRLVFCLYAEDAGLFGRHDIFHDYLSAYKTDDLRQALMALFKVLDTPEAERDPYLNDDLLAFPYTNGGLFSEDIVIPRLNDEIRDLLLHHASYDFDWSLISPTIFGAVFESTLNPDTRRSGGMHYTSIENIHKVIDPLFLDDLSAELDQILAEHVEKTRQKRILAYQDRLASLTFFDPACGSGNFLTETYLSLRRLENRALRAYAPDAVLSAEMVNPVKVSINQFYGIEINDFAVSVATTALWISEAQMLHETEKITGQDINFLPLKSYTHIHQGNALRMDWATVIPPEQLHYIMGNPPFVGFTYMDAAQKEDMKVLFPGINNLDYVAGWYKKASDFIQGTKIECGFVSTNSITQGETVARLWERLNICINYAHRSFVWNSEASLKAHVHCVIIGFAAYDKSKKYIYENGVKHQAKNINPYLVDAENVLVSSRNKSLCNVPQMVYGNKPADGGALIIEDADYEEFVKKEPNAKKYIRPLLGAVEFLHNKKRWCLWLVNATPNELRQMPLVMARIRQCKETRENSIAAAIRKFAETPTLFAQRTQPEGKDYILVPRVSSENRRYVPMAFLTSDTIVTDAVQIIPDATLYHFGVLTSNVHNAWMRAVCGRLKSDYRYSKDIVYNNFPWPEPTEAQRQRIAATAQQILDVRAKYPDSSLADLYDPTVMPYELLQAHRDNDRAVMAAYGFATSMTETDCVAALLKQYKTLVAE